MAQANLTSANDALTLPTTGRNETARISTGAAAAAGCVIVLEVEGVAGEFIAIQVWNQLTSAWASNITGASQTGFADVPATAQIRARRTDGTGTASPVSLNVREG